MCTNMCLLFARDTFLTFPSSASAAVLLCIYTRENYSPWRLTLVAALAILSPSGDFLMRVEEMESGKGKEKVSQSEWTF